MKYQKGHDSPSSRLLLSRRAFGLGAAAVGAGYTLQQFSAPAYADNYPSRTITIIAPASAGGPTDAVGRASAKALSERIKQAVIVENKSGASSNIGAQYVAKSAPDGYTLVVLPAPVAQNMAIFRQPGFNIETDFIPLAHMASVDLVVAARKDLLINNLDDFLVYAKAHPNKLSCGSQSPPQMEYLMRTTGVQYTVVPYKGSALITNDLIAGQVDIGLVPYSDIAQHVEAGNVKVLFTNGPQRIRQLPNVQRVGERFPGFYFWSWYGIAAPSNTPEPVVKRLRQELISIAKSPEFVSFLDKVGLAPVDHPEKFNEVIKAEVDNWKNLVDELKLQRI